MVLGRGWTFLEGLEVVLCVMIEAVLGRVLELALGLALGAVFGPVVPC